MLKTKTAIIGGGPVGLLGSLLLSKFNIDFICFQKHDKLRSHPSAHWLSARSKQIIQQINNLHLKIDQSQQDFNNFKYYRYCKQIGGIQFGKTNHFLPSIQQKLQTSFNMFNNYPNHISQTKLLHLLYQNLQQKNRILFNNEIIDIEKKNDCYQIKNHKNQVVCQAKYVILCNGFNSHLRSKLNVKLQEGKQFYKLINIHFQSKKLAKIIKHNKIEAMLYFIYNSKIPCVLVNHSLQQGDFVLQIPNYQPFVDLLNIYSPFELIQTAIKQQHFRDIQGQINIKNVGRWKLQGTVVDKMNKQNIFLAGDTAHTYTPAGGFGMNCGFQDINHLTHTIHTIQRNKQINQTKLIDMYNLQRVATNRQYLMKSMKNYELTDEIANQLGFPSRLTEYFFKFCRFLPDIKIPFVMNYNQQMRLLALKGLFSPKDINPKLQLFFDDFDYKVQRLSTHLGDMIQSVNDNQIYDIWIDNNVQNEEIQDLFGKINTQNIKRMALKNNQKIIRRDGIVLK